MNRLANARIRSAAADEIAHHRVDVGVTRIRLVAQERARRHDHPGLAVAALRDVFRDPSALTRMRRIARESFDRREPLSVGVARRDLARADGLAVLQHCARAADADAAAELRAGHAEDVAE